jgi:hypothetical protein
MKGLHDSTNCESELP